MLAVVSFGQVRTVTNSTLEKFQQKRLAAERQYRENYERMGFPSPEELDRQRDADLTARIELADQLRMARLEKERIELERRSLDLEAARLDAELEADTIDNGFYGGYVVGYGFGGSNFGGRGKFRRHSRFGRFSTGGYRATPFGVIPVPRTPRPQRILRTSPRFGNRRR
jgi:hypothetical protein